MSDGRTAFKFSAARNGNQINDTLYDTASDAKAVCEQRAAED
jgi:hypothetical protein